MASKGKLIIVDGNSLLYRAFFAMPHFSTFENIPTNAVYGFTMMLLKLFETEKPDVLLVAFDPPTKTFRHADFADYKAHRKPTPDDLRAQAPLARAVVEAFNTPHLEIDGYEADDVVGTIARKGEHEGYDVLIVTGDQDMLQLVDDKVRVMRTIKGVTETMVYDSATVLEKYGVTPDQFVDYKALIGDSSDNIPGVPGIGKVNAAKLIAEYGDLENLLAHADEIKPARFQSALKEHADDARQAKSLSTIVTEVPMEISLSECKLRKPDSVKLRELFERLEFKSLIGRIPAGEPEKAQAETPAVKEFETKVIQISTTKELASLLDEVRSAGKMAIRIEASSANAMQAEPEEIAICYSPGRSAYIPFKQSSCCLEDIREIMEDSSVAKFGWNLKFDIEILRRSGIEVNNPSFDAMIAAYLIDPARGSMSLEDIAAHYLGISFGTSPEQLHTLPGLGDGVERGQLLGSQADAVIRLEPVLRECLESDGLQDVMDAIEMPLVPILADMELAGVGVDTEYLGCLADTLGSRIKDVEQEVFELAGMEFNIGSTKQLQSVLFEKLLLPSSKKTKTGYSTDADTLAALAPSHEIVAKILEYRELTKLKSTYADALPRLINPKTGRIHTSLNQAVTSTGRLSSSEPNLQNIPIKTEIGRRIRRAFVAEPGNTLVSADYSQIELRILAHVTHDPGLLHAFREGIDIHRRTATVIFGIAMDEVTSDMRRQAKTVNFAVIYGMSDYGLSRELNIPVGIAKQYISNYFRDYAGVKSYSAEVLVEARKCGYVQSLLGRRRYLPELNSSNRSFREFAERAAFNMPIQGTAADIVKLAMIEVHKRLALGGFKAKMILQVHDELVFEVPESEEKVVVSLIIEAMQNAYRLDVPLLVEVKCGKDWCTALPVSITE
jgi:DNA polymerase-1